MAILRRSYSQFAEDLLAESYLGQTRGVTYIDIGCLWPDRLSNTYRFYKNNGRGVCIDPNPTLEELYRAERPTDIFVNSGVSSQDAELLYTMFENPVFNTFDPERRARVVESGQKGRGGRGIIGERIVPVKPLSQILDQIGWYEKFEKTDLLCIDVEGHELDVLSSVPFDRLKPRLVICEVFGKVGNVLDSAVSAFLVGKGYTLVGATGHDAFFRLDRKGAL